MSDSTMLAPPVSLLEQPIRVTVDWKKLLATLGKSFAKALYGKYVTGDSVKVDGAVSDALGAFGLQIRPGPDEIAWNLCRRALGTALVELIRPESIRTLPEDKPEAEFRDEFVQQIDWTMIRLDPSFFEHPEQFPFLRPVQAILEEWLVSRGMERAEAHNVASRLPSHFVFALHDEWRSKRAEYEPLERHIQTPFTKASDREHAWLRHAAALKKACDASMFGETFGLAQVYVPLRAYHEERLGDERDRRSSGHVPVDGQRIRRLLVKADEKLDAWVSAGDKADALRVLSGGPGSGKSSCAKMFAARMAARGHHVLIIPLHLVNPDDRIPAMVRQFVDDGDHLPFDPLDTQADEPLLLIFDGLDELSMQGKSGADAAKGFLEEVRRFVEARNHGGLRVQVLVGGREIVVQQARHILREAKQILTLLPYCLSPEVREHEKYQFVDYEASPEDLDQDQRVVWWNQYTAAKGQTPPGMPDELNRPELVEITAQPLLNYLVALSRERKTLDFTQNALRNRIYRDLLEGVYNRAHRERKPHPATSELGLDQFTELLEEIGLAVWHGNGRTATVKEIRAHCGERIDQLLRPYDDGEARVMGLLTAFYFRKHHSRRDDEATFEFTHKSFGEYLTARRIVRTVRDMHDDKAIASKRRGWDMKDALRDWAKLCGPMAMDRHLLHFVIDEVALEEREVCTQWQALLQDLIEHVLNHGMPMERIVPRPNYQQEMHQARNAEEALLVCLYACSERTEMVSRVEWPDRRSARAWLHRLYGQVSGKVRMLALRCLGRLDLSKCELDSLDLYLANLRGALLLDANLNAADLRYADLGRANLKGADLADANLQGTNLFRANLQGADLRGADLQGANLTDANLRGADLADVNLQGANLTDALMDSPPEFDDPPIETPPAD